ncbi:hypothetical protein G6F37_002880 [Rhizopus arrhizus]|nr:hypothetical protein G6F38_003156 [Rhizopus arrhizus]KAG1161647.1 hypothetical protein G6F37_002880 [Rhizopus arrhizus]
MAEHPNKIAFEEGVGYILKSWTALKLAVEQDWGGVESAEKRDWMIDVIVDVFGKRGKKTEVDEIEEILSQIMVDEFQVILEDDSPYHVAKHLFGLYNQCVQGDFTEVERLREKFKSQNQFAASSCMKQASDDEDDSGDDDNDEQGDEDDQDMEEATPEEPLVDEDGWETVRRK